MHTAQIDMLSSRFDSKKMCHSSNNRKKKRINQNKMFEVQKIDPNGLRQFK